MQMQKFLSDVSAKTYWSDGGVTISVARKEGTPIVLDTSRPSDSELLASLTSMTAESFGTVLDEDSNDGTRRHVDGVDGLAIVHNDETPFGFASVFSPREEMLYLHGIALSGCVKGRGYSRRMLRALLECTGQENLVCTTQSPVVFRMLNSIFESVYPNPFAPIPEDLRGKAQRLMGARSEKFNPKTGVAVDLYDNCLYQEIPLSAEKPIDDWFTRSLSIESGRTKSGFLFFGVGLRPASN